MSARTVMTAGDFGYICDLVREQSALTLEAGKEYLVESRLDPLAREQGFPSFQKMVQRSTLADAHHQSGTLTESSRLFQEAERLQTQSQAEYQMLYSVRGYQYCDLLLAQGQTVEVLRRASQTLAIAIEQFGPLDIGLDHLSLGRAYPAGSPEAANHLNQAVDSLRRAGQLDYIPLGLLARGTSRDLDEVLRIATRSGMRLHLADYHLISARNAIKDADKTKARDHFVQAETLVNETGYHRRDPELAALRLQLGI